MGVLVAGLCHRDRHRRPAGNRRDKQVPESVADMAFGFSGDPRLDLVLGQAASPAVVYAMPNFSR